MEYWGLLAIVRRFVMRPTQPDRAVSSKRLRRILILIAAPILLLAGAGQVMADSPPNLTADIDWSAGTSSVADVEAAFNHGRREEEKQLGLAAGTLGNLNLPSQAGWDATSDDLKALTIMNAERTARAGMKAGVIGLPFTAVQTDVDSLAQYYANYLVANNKTGHTADGRTPFQRIDDGPVLGPCHEFLHRAENLAYAWTSNPTIGPVVLENSIYNWIYDDASSGWGHREAVLLQDEALDYPDEPQYGFNNNVGSPTDEGFIGIGTAQSPSYDPDGLGWVKMGYALVMNVIDPISTGTCPWDGAPPVGPTVTSITPSSGENTGWLLITNLAGTGFQDGATVKLERSGQPDIVPSSVKWVNATKMTCAFNLTAAAPGAWDVVVTNPDAKSGKLANGFTVTGAAGGPTVTSITPNTGPNTGPIQITNLAGSGFQAGAAVKLSRPGETDIVGTSVQVVSASKITCVFDLSVAAGVYRWDVVVTNPDAKSATLPNGFRITGPGPEMPYSAFLPAVMRPQTTWNNQPSQAESYGQMVVTSGQFQRYSMDVTGLVRGWVNGSFPSYGVMLRGPESSGGQPAVIGFATLQYREGQFAAALDVTHRSPAAGERTERFVTVADTTVLQGAPNTYFGAEQSMWTGYDVCWGYQAARSLLGFSVTSIPAGATVVKATLHLEQVLTCHYGPSSRTITAYRIGSNWFTNETKPSGSYRLGPEAAPPGAGPEPGLLPDGTRADESPDEAWGQSRD